MTRMNQAARFVMWILGFIGVLFAVAAVGYPLFGKPVPDVVTKELGTIIVLFVGMLAKTGSEQAPPPPQE